METASVLANWGTNDRGRPPSDPCLPGLAGKYIFILRNNVLSLRMSPVARPLAVLRMIVSLTNYQKIPAGHAPALAITPGSVVR
jgi:hypothetical protein